MKSQPLSITHPGLVSQWHQTKNGDLTPDTITQGSARKAWWICKDGHEWETHISSRSSKGYTGCPYCNNANPKASPEYNLVITHPHIAKEWCEHLNSPLTPDQITCGSGKKYWWQCKIKSHHVWEATPNKRTARDSGCPYCSGKRVNHENCFSVTHPLLSDEWCATNHISPRDLSFGSATKVNWQCPKNQFHIYVARVTDRVQGYGCPYCTGLKVNPNSAFKASNTSCGVDHTSVLLLGSTDPFESREDDVTLFSFGFVYFTKSIVLFPFQKISPARM